MAAIGRIDLPPASIEELLHRERSLSRMNGQIDGKKKLSIGSLEETNDVLPKAVAGYRA